MIILATTLNNSAHHIGLVAPNTSAIAIPPNET
ncbi:MAG: hypothetical protein CM15mP9_4640 [Methanobacteriota archaeon]|nr:MAG: hypothetical protein CM15mP9_4640 [Euryarchaeota archaeon]